jgi:hypothetical protein
VGEARNAYRILVELSLGKPRRKNNTIQMDITKPGCDDEKEMELAQNCVQWQTLVLAILSLGSTKKELVLLIIL